MSPAIEFNPQFISYLTNKVAHQLRQAISQEYDLPLSDIPALAVADLPNISPDPNLHTKKMRLSATGTYELVTVTPAELSDRAILYIENLGPEGLSHLATDNDISLEQTRARIIQGAAFDVVTEAMLGLVCTTFDTDDRNKVLSIAVTNLGLRD